MTLSLWTVVLIVLALVFPLATLWYVVKKAREQAPFLFGDELMYRLTLDDRGLRLLGPGDETQELAWSDVSAVQIRTTDSGPFAEDVFWEFAFGNGSELLSVPNSATEVHDFLDILAARFPGFDHEAVIGAMGSTDDAVFHAWPPAEEE
jgi:hypothetical protein